MNDANHTNTFELGPYSRAEIAEEALREIASYHADELREWQEENAADMVEIAQRALSRVGRVR